MRRRLLHHRVCSLEEHWRSAQAHAGSIPSDIWLPAVFGDPAALEAVTAIGEAQCDYGIESAEVDRVVDEHTPPLARVWRRLVAERSAGA
jgi:hypothetical protein